MILSKIKKVPEFISYVFKYKLINLIKAITVVGMGIVTYDYGLEVFNGNVLQAIILVVVIEGTSIAFMLNSYGLTPKVRLTYIGCLLLVSGLINIIHAAKIGDENLDSYFSVLIAVLSVLNIFAFNLISILKKNSSQPELNLIPDLNVDLIKALKNELNADLIKLNDLNNASLNLIKEDLNRLNNTPLNLINNDLNEKNSEFNISELNEKPKEKKVKKLNLDLKENLNQESQNKKRGRPKKI